MDSKTVKLWGSGKMSLFTKKVEYPFKPSQIGRKQVITIPHLNA